MDQFGFRFAFQTDSDPAGVTVRLLEADGYAAVLVDPANAREFARMLIEAAEEAEG